MCCRTQFPCVVECPMASSGREGVEPYLGLQVRPLGLQEGHHFPALLQLTLQGGGFPFCQELLLHKKARLSTHMCLMCEQI